MVIRPVIPATEPEVGQVPPLRTLPFRPQSNFLELMRAAARAKAAFETQPRSHVVRTGESLWRICKDALSASGAAPSKSDINDAVRRIAAANRLKDADVLSVGQKLDLSALRNTSSNAAGGPVGLLKAGRLTAAPAPNATRGTTQPTHIDTADSQVARQPSAVVARPLGDAKGGGEPVSRPLYRRLSNARPPLHLPPRVGAAETTMPTPEKTVDLTALMQSILDPGSDPTDSSSVTGPWSKILAGAGRFTSGFGIRKDPFSGKLQFHDGIDIAAAPGTAIYPYMTGTVKSAGWDAGHGNVVVIDHPNGMQTVYAHASQILVKAGDVVLKDTPIAKVGSTGHSTGPHLHFEVRQNNKAINPLPLITQDSLNVAKAL